MKSDQNPFKNGIDDFKDFSGGISFGVHKNSAAWIMFQCIDNHTGDIISIDYGQLDYVFVFSKSGDLLVDNMGDHGGFDNRYIQKQSPNFMIDQRFGPIFFIKVSSEGSINIPIRISSLAKFQRNSLLEYLFYGSFLGLLSGLGLYNLFLSLTLKRKVYAFYVLYVVSSLMTQANLAGFFGTYIWPTAQTWMNKSVIFCFILFWISTSLFTIEYLKLKEHSRALFRFFVAMIAICIILGIFSVFSEYSSAIKLVQYLIILLSILKIFSGISVWRKNYEPAKYFTMSWSFFMLANIVLTLRDMGYINPTFFVNHLSMAGSVSEVILLSLGLGSYIRSVEQEKTNYEKKADELAIVSQTMQMIAHDVRKPFTIMANTMDVLANAKAENVSQLANEFLPDVKRTLKEVSGLFDDVIAVGDDHKLNILDQSVYQIIKESLKKNAVSGMDLDLKYQLKHTNMLSVDISKVTRIFSNIVENAIQAQNGGYIWFTSSEGDKWITIIIGNSGSFIPEIDRKKVFDMFFTKGKSKGTGLGLAIAEKFVKIHGGKIACQSKENYGTEFIITLPKSNKVDTFEAMPSKLNEGSIFASKMIVQNEDTAHIEILTDKIVQGQPVRVLVLDDEVIYQKLLLELVPHKIRDFVVFDFCSTVMHARELFQKISYDLMIIDFDLGKNQLSGFDFLEEVKSGSFLKVMHTNRSESSFSKKSYEKGADYFLSKPMTSSHFVKFIYEVTTRKTNISMDVIIIDDEPEHLRPAIMLLKTKYNITTFESVDALLDELDKGNSAIDLSKVAYIFVDRFIGRFDITKQNVPDNLRKYGYLNKIILFSNSVSEDSELPRGFDSMISKELSALRNLTGI